MLFIINNTFTLKALLFRTTRYELLFTLIRYLYSYLYTYTVNITGNYFSLQGLITMIRNYKKFTKLGALTLVSLLLTSGVSAVFTDSVSTQTQNLDTGTGGIELTAGDLEASATSSVEDLVPGDTVTRDVVVTNTASYDFSKVSMSVADSEPSTPLTSSSEGLRMTVERENSPNNWSIIYGPGSSVGNVISDIGGNVLLAGQSTHLRITQHFVGPDNGKLLKDKSAKLTYTFNALQRTGNGVVVGSGSTYSNAILASNPAHFYELDETSGNVLADFGSNSAPGALVAGKFLSQAGLTTSPANKSLMATNGAPFGALPANVFPVNSAFTVEFLYNIPNSTVLNTGRTMLGIQPEDGIQRFTVMLDGIPRIFTANPEGFTSLYADCESCYAVGTHHVAVVFDGTTLKVYGNGQLAGSVTNPKLPTALTGDPFRLGGYQFTSGSVAFGGALDELAIFNRALTEAEIATHFAAR